MAVGYRTILELDSDSDALIVARGVVEDWVQEKSTRLGLTEPSLDLSTSGIHPLSLEMTVTTALSDGRATGRDQQVFRLLETNPTGRWQVTIVALAVRADHVAGQTLMVEVEPLDLDSDGAVFTTKPPRLIADLISRHSVRSGGVRMTARPVVMDVDAVDKVLSAITDPDRAAAVVVAASLDGVDTETWTDVVSSLLRESLGVATGFVLTVEAAQAINQRLPYGFHVKPGGIRTFAPGADLADDADQYRHRYLGPQSFARYIQRYSARGQTRLKVDSRFAATHAQRARRRFVELRLPAQLRAANDLLRTAEFTVERQEAALAVRRPHHPQTAQDAQQPRQSTVIDTAAPAPVCQPDTGPQRKAPEPPVFSPGPEVSDATVAEIIPATWMADLRVLVESVTGSSAVSGEAIAEISDVLSTSRRALDVAKRQLDEPLDEWQRATDERDELRSELDDAQLESHIATETALDYQRRFEHYQGRLLETERYEDLHVPDEDQRWTPPENFDEFLLRLEGDGQDVEPVSDYVVFTGNREAALAIDDRDQTSRYVRHMWDFVKVLDAFASVRDTGFEGDVRAYLNADQVIGHKCTARQHAASESETVRNRQSWRDERLFPVPPSVHPDGKIHMMAHFRPSHDSSFAPRLHYYDDTGKTGKIYIGYIGRHLTNTKTASA